MKRLSGEDLSYLFELVRHDILALEDGGDPSDLAQARRVAAWLDHEMLADVARQKAREFIAAEGRDLTAGERRRLPGVILASMRQRQ